MIDPLPESWAWRPGAEYFDRICYELLPFIKETKTLNDEYQRRVALYQKIIETRTKPMTEKTNALLLVIEEMTEEERQQWNSLHLENFGAMEELCAGKRCRPSVRTIEQCLDVCNELIVFLELNETKRSEERVQTNVRKESRPRIRYKGSGRLEYQGEEYLMRSKNDNYVLLCDKVYALCQKVGSTAPAAILWKELIFLNFSSDPVGAKKRLYQTARTANRWAEINKLPTLFKCVKEGVIRLV